MAGEIVSPNMFLPVPTSGITTGPQYALDTTNCFNIIDAHDHTPGSGVQITPGALNINANLSFNDNSLTDVLSILFTPQSVALTGETKVYVVDDDLYYNDGNGDAIQITQNGGVAGSPGSISNLTSPASASYVAVDSTFVWQSAASTPANMDFAAALLRNLSANSKSLTLQPPAAMAADYEVTLPNLPAANNTFLTMNTSGQISSTYTVDGTSLSITGSTFGVKTDAEFPGVPTAGSSNIVVTKANEASTLAIMIGQVEDDGSILNGEGFTITKGSTGIYTINFTVSWAVEPSITVICENSNNGRIPTTVSLGVASTQIRIRTTGDSLTNNRFTFIAIGRK